MKNSQHKVAITGMGIISSIGLSVKENLKNLLAQKHGISNLELINSIHTGRLKVGEIKFSNEELLQKLNISSNNALTRSAILGIWAANEAIKSAEIQDINQYKTGLISSTTVGGMDTTELYFNQYENLPEKQKYIHTHDAGITTLEIAKHIDLQGFTSTISTACSSSTNAIILGAKMILSGKLDRVIVGGCDALSKFTINGFNTLMILSDKHNTPFDENRNGLNLGEGAGFLVLESEKIIKKENKKILAYLSGFANNNDAHHQTASSENGDGAFLAMENALKKAKLFPENIDYINAHGTATPNNDLSEGNAILRIFNPSPPPLSSTKPFTGHTLAACGVIEAIFCILALEKGIIYPNLNFKKPMKEFSLRPHTELTHQNLTHILSNSFGFGGNCSSLIFSKK